jgi:hypothetical protein
VAFWAAGKLKKISLDGGSPVVLCNAEDLLGGSWGDDGNIVAAVERGRLSRVPSAGGAPEVILDLSKEAFSPEWPQVLPGAKRALVTMVGSAGADSATIELVSLSTRERHVVARGATYGRYLPNGYLMYVNQGTIFTQPFDLERIRPRGPAVPMPGRIAYSAAFGFAQVDFSQTGTLVYRRSGEQLVPRWLDSASKVGPPLLKPAAYVWPALSPDGSRLAVAVTESGVSSVWIQEGQPDRITRLPSPCGYPLWTPDGRFLVLGSGPGLRWARSDGTGKVEPLTGSAHVQIPASFSPDGKRIAFSDLNPATGFDLWTAPIIHTGTGLKAGAPEPFLRTPAFETYPMFSPDGHWIAYGSNESGSWEVYVRAFPDNGTKTQVSSGGGRIGRWSRSGKELLYRTDSNRIMVAAYTVNGGEFEVTSVRPWSPLRLADTGVFSNFDLSADGRRIVGLVPDTPAEDEPAENHVTFVFNFLDEVQRRSPKP